MSRPVQRWVLRGASVVAAGLIAWLFTDWIGLRPRPVLLVGVILGCYALGWVFTDLAHHATGIDWRPPRRRVVPRHGLDPRFLRMASLMRDETDRALVSVRMHQTLVRIIDDRLMAHHGLDRRTRPEESARVLGPGLTRYVDDSPSHSHLSPRYLNDLLTRIEAL